MGAGTKTEKMWFRMKVAAAVALLVIFATVVFSVPAERLAWQGQYVIGALHLPKPSPTPYTRPEKLAESADSSFNLLAFLSVVGIIFLGTRRLPDVSRPRRNVHPNLGFRTTVKDKITIMYIL